MVVARLVSPAVLGLETSTVQVEVDLRAGLPAFSVVGLADVAVQEARERVRSGLVNQAFAVPARRIVANLAPADLRKAGPQYDLPLALAILVASGQLAPDAVAGVGAVGELALDGSLRPVPGALAMAEHAARAGWTRILVPRANAAEAALVPGVEVLGPSTLRAAVDLLEGRAEPSLVPLDPEALLGRTGGAEGADMSEVRGQGVARRALEIAAAGGHSMLMIGPPGGGKTMLARRMPGILPPLRLEEAIEVTRIHSVAGLLDPGCPLVVRRPFRAPHHTISAAGLVGGGPVPASGRGQPRPPWRPLPRRGVRLRPLGPRRAAPAPRGGQDRRHPGDDQRALPGPAAAGVRGQSVPVRLRRRSRPAAASARPAGPRPTGRGSPARWPIASTSTSPCPGSTGRS